MIASRQSIHHAYLVQVLVDRGVKPPPAAQVQAYLDSLADDQMQQEQERLRNIAKGVEGSGDLTELLEAIRAAPLKQELPLPCRASGVREREPEREKTGEARADSRHHLSLLRSHGVHVYGAKAALKIELTSPGPSQDDLPREYTLQVEGAERKASGHGYEWTRKISFQLMRRELPLLASFVLGFARKQFELKFHGQAADKLLRIEDQGQQLYVQLGHSGRQLIRVPVEPAETFAVGELCLACLRLNRPTTGDEGLIALLRRVGHMEAACRSERQ